MKIGILGLRVTERTRNDGAHLDEPVLSRGHKLLTVRHPLHRGHATMRELTSAGVPRLGRLSLLLSHP